MKAKGMIPAIAVLALALGLGLSACTPSKKEVPLGAPPTENPDFIELEAEQPPADSTEAIPREPIDSLMVDSGSTE